MSKDITVGISDMNIAKNGDGLVTYALGSCVGICLYDDIRKIAGMSHIMLPSSIGMNSVGRQSLKFADLAIPKLVEMMENEGARRISIKAKIAGGAQMFASINNSSLATIGERNIYAVKQTLQKLKIPIMAEDTGSNYGRTQYFSSEDGKMRIKSVNRGEHTY